MDHTYQFHALLQIVILDESQSDFQTLQRLFRQQGCNHSLLHFRTGQDVCAFLRTAVRNAAREQTAQLVVLNLQGDREEQLESLRELKQDPATRAVPVIVLCNSTDESLVQRCYDAGASSYLFRPDDPVALAERVDRIIRYWCETAMLPVRQPAAESGLQTVV